MVNTKNPTVVPLLPSQKQSNTSDRSKSPLRFISAHQLQQNQKTNGRRKQRIIHCRNPKRRIKDDNSNGNHPLTEISQSPGHLLLLKLLQREEHLFARKIATKETRIHSINREVSHLCTFYLFFHGLFFILLFSSSTNNRYHVTDWWIPYLISLSTSLAIISIAQVKLIRYWKVRSRLEKEKCENRAVGRRAMELRMKGASFDLSEEPNDLRGSLRAPVWR